MHENSFQENLENLLDKWPMFSFLFILVMSLRTRDREREQRARQKSVHFKWITLGIIAAFALCVITFAFKRQKTHDNTNAGEHLKSFQSFTADLLAKMSNDQLESINIEVRNLVCGMDLSNDIAVTQDELLKRLDEMTQRVKVETERNFHRFHKEPSSYGNSEAYYRMLMLVTVLQQDYGMLYNPQRVTKAGLIEPNSSFYANPRDVFMHGLLLAQHSGTCASLPVLAIAVGRQLGYPLALVSTQNHLFVRWNGQNEKFNVEVTSKGMNSHPDEYYRKCPYPITAEAERENGYLQPMSAAEETSVFLSLRAFCLMAQGRVSESISAHEQAAKLAPRSLHYQKILKMAKVEEQQRSRPFQSGKRPFLPPHPLFQDPNLPPEINWAMWESHENARKQQQEEERIQRNAMLGNPMLSPLGATGSSISPLPQPHQFPNSNNQTDFTTPNHKPF